MTVEESTCAVVVAGLLVAYDIVTVEVCVSLGYVEQSNKWNVKFVI